MKSVSGEETPLNRDTVMLFGVEITTPRLLFLFGVLGFLGIASYGLCNGCFGELILLSLSSLLVGALGGFLFGIPKMGKGKDGGVKSNTNLEEISDWLTKIIVGIGLAQLPSIKDNVILLVGFVSDDLAGLPKSIIFFLFTYFLLYGFFFSYLSTRIYLGLVFAQSDERVAAAQAGITKATQDIPDNTNHQDDNLIKNVDGMDLEALLSKVRIVEKNGKIDGVTYRKLGVRFFSEANYGLASEFFKKSYDTGKDLVSLCNLGVVVGKYFGKHEKADEIFDDVIRQDAVSPLAYYNKACNLIRMNKRADAIENLKQALLLGKEQFLKIAQNDPSLELIAQEPGFKDIVPDYQSSPAHGDTHIKI